MAELALLEDVGEAVLAIGADGRVDAAAGATQSLLGRDPDALAGLSLAELIGVASTGDHRLALRHPDGTQIPVLASVRRLDDGQLVALADLRPWVGEGFDSPAAGLDRALGAVFRGALAASRGEFEGEEDPERIAATLAEQAARLIPRTDCLIALLDTGRPDVFRVAGGAGPWAGTMVGQDFTVEGAIVGRALAAREPVEVMDAQLVSTHGRVLAGGGIRTARLIPIVTEQPLPDGRSALGTIGFYSRRASAFTPDQRRLMDEFATLVSLSLMRAALRRAARVGAERQETALELAADLSRTLDPRQVVGRLLDRALTAADAQRVVILRVDGADTVTEDYRDVDGHSDLLGFRHPIEAQPLMARALALAAPVAGERYRSGSFPEVLRAALEGVRHTLTVPLMLGAEPVAVLVLSRRVDRVFGEDEVRTVRVLGGLAALALRNARLFVEAREANRVKSDFLNMAAHELRTPLTVVAGYVSMLEDGSLGAAEAAFRQPLETLSAKTGELGRLVEDLLLAARLETGGLPVQAVRFSAAVAVAAAIDRAAPRAGLFGADVGADIPDPAPEAFGDPQHVARILDNLLNNSLTYSRGTPFVRLRVRRAGDWVRFEVEDRGRGIPASEAERVFERFHRLEADDRRSQPGTGLGLYICRQLAERQSGRLVLEWSRPGEGSRFVLLLPAALQ